MTILNREITQDFIRAYEEKLPAFLVSISYFRKEDNLERIYANNKRINKVLDDLLNPRGDNDFIVSKDHFIERRRRTLKKIKAIKVKNTIVNRYQFDYEAEISKPVFDTHHLIGNIKDSVIQKPNKNIKTVFLKLYGAKEPPESVSYEQLKIAIMDFILRKRCNNFIGTSQQCLDFKTINDHQSFNGLYGANGAITYVTKKIHDIDDYGYLFDIKNSSIIPK